MALHTAAHGSAVAGSSTLLPSNSRVHAFFQQSQLQQWKLQQGTSQAVSIFSEPKQLYTADTAAGTANSHAC